MDRQTRHLPKHDGQDILKHLRSTERYAPTPVIVMTSLNSSITGDKAAKNAALVYFTKPSALDEFLKRGSIVRSLLEARSSDGGAALEEKKVGPAA